MKSLSSIYGRSGSNSRAGSAIVTGDIFIDVLDAGIVVIPVGEDDEDNEDDDDGEEVLLLLFAIGVNGGDESFIDGTDTIDKSFVDKDDGLFTIRLNLCISSLALSNSVANTDCLESELINLR